MTDSSRLPPTRTDAASLGRDDALAAAVAEPAGWSTTPVATATPAELAERQRRADRLLDAEGAGHLIHDALAPDGATSRPWRLDPIPYVVSAAEFALLADAAAQRLALAEAMFDDMVGAQRLVRDGIVPPTVWFGDGGVRPVGRATGAGGAPRRNVVHLALDVVRLADGTWRVVQQLTDAPVGLGYTLIYRSVSARVMPDALRSSGAASIADAPTHLRRALLALAPTNRRSPRVVVLSGGPAHVSYVDQSSLAMQMGVHLAEGGDLVVRRQRVWLRVLDGVEPVDVVYRRVEDRSLDPLDVRATGGLGVPALTWAAQADGVGLGNACGTAVLESVALEPSLDAASRLLLGAPLLLDARRPTEVVEHAPVFHAERRHPFELAPVVVRLQVVASSAGAVVVPGGVGRVVAAGDDLRRPTAQLAKDVWVLDETRRVPLVVAAAPPQVDFGSSVPRRAADALFWLGRAAERAEHAARAVRVVTTAVQADPGLVDLDDGAWTFGVIGVLRAARGASAVVDPDAHDHRALAHLLADELAATVAAVAAQVTSLVQEAMSVREFMSTTTGRVLGRLVRMRQTLLDDLERGDPDSVGLDGSARVEAIEVDDLDTVLTDLAALAGLAMESTVRGPAWRFLDLGRRLERALGIVAGVEAALAPIAPPLTVQPLTEVLLASNESLVAYRRRHRSEVEMRAVLDLLVHDDANPRGLAFQLDRLREHVASLAWHRGGDLVQRASLGALVGGDDAVVAGRRLGIDRVVLDVRGPLLDLVDDVIARWFADPVDPITAGRS
jgi:uncharacterized circularly permuted ATP-grasp superfamily protein/uncharacterized alpha-E superfamily protein